MPTILIVDDSSIDRCLAGGLVGAIDEAQVEYASDGSDALVKMELHVPDLVVTDLDMPSINGLELVELIRKAYPMTPVILMTAQGSEEIAVQALRAGAASYVPKRQLNLQLGDTVQQVLQAARLDRGHLRLMRRLVREEMEFVIENDLDLVASMVQHFQDTALAIGVCDETDRMRIGVALQEALTNASFHGNLEMCSDLREGDHRDYYELAMQRSSQPPWSERRLYVTARFMTGEVEFRIRDEGKGFDPKCIRNPTDPANLDRASGRGLLLMHSFMDEVRYNATGNEVTLIKRRKKPGDTVRPDTTIDTKDVRSVVNGADGTT